MQPLRAPRFFALALACFALILSMRYLAAATGSPPIVAPEAGFALGALLVCGRQFWPAILIGTLAALVTGPPGHSIAGAAGLALSLTLAAWLGKTLFRKRRPDPVSISVADAPLLALASGTTAILASAGPVMLGLEPFGTLIAALARNAVGVVVVVPLLLSWQGAGLRHWGGGRIVHLLMILTTTAVVSAGIASRDNTDMVAWSLFPVLVWSALAFQRRGASLTLAILAAFLTVGTAYGHGPFMEPSLLGPATFGQICIAAVSVTLLILAERADARQAYAQMRETERRLHDRDGQLALFVDNVPSSVAIFDREMRYVAASRRFRSDCGIAPETVLPGVSHYELFPDLPPRWRGIYDRVLAGAELSNAEEPWLAPNGRPVIVRWTMKPWRDRDGEIAGLILIIQVVTEAVEYRQRIEAAEARYRGVFDQAAVGVARLSLEGRYLEINDRGCEILGRGRDELLAADFTSFLPSEDIPEDIVAAREMVAGVRRSYAVEKRIDAGQLGAEWILLTVSLIRNAEGVPECFVSVIQDITARKRAEADLRESEARLRLAQEAAGVGIWEMDIDRGVVIQSPLSMRLHELPDAPDGTISFAAMMKTFGPDLTAQAGTALMRAIEQGAPYDITFPLDLPDGSQRWLHSFGRHEPRPGGIGLIRGASIDVTAAHQQEANLVEAHEKLVRLSRLSAMGAMASTLAHELNQPLTAVANYTQGCHRLLSKRENADDDMLVEMLARASAEALRAGDIIRKIRQFTESGVISRKPEDLRALIADVWAREDASTSGVEFSTKFGPRTAAVVVDRLQMEQVLSNLFRNAAEAMADSPTRHLTVEASEDEGNILIQVRDTGPGLSDDALTHLFDPFRTTKASGMGLGLALCRTIVEAHGGRLWAENAAGGGAVFNILLRSRVAQEELERGL